MSSSSAGKASPVTSSPSCIPSWMAYCPIAPAEPVTARVWPGRRPSMSRADRTVIAFIGRVAAASSEKPSGTRASWSSSTRTYSACAPPPGTHGDTAAITRSPACHDDTSGPTASITPARSMPAMYGDRMPSGSCRPPARNPRSVGFTVAAATRTRTWPGPGDGTGSVRTRSTEGSPNSVKQTARISVIMRLHS